MLWFKKGPMFGYISLNYYKLLIFFNRKYTIKRFPELKVWIKKQKQLKLMRQIICKFILYLFINYFLPYTSNSRKCTLLTTTWLFTKYVFFSFQKQSIISTNMGLAYTITLSIRVGRGYDSSFTPGITKRHKFVFFKYTKVIIIKFYLMNYQLSQLVYILKNKPNNFWNKYNNGIII